LANILAYSYPSSLRARRHWLMLRDMELGELQREWDRFGREDPLWAILTAPGKKHGGWNPQDFFYSGQVEIARVMEKLHTILDGAHQISGRALDFGCGVGRATQALCGYFDRVEGVDISEAMIDQANRYNRFGDRCVYHVNHAADLGMFGDAAFDFVYTAHVLQHMQPIFARAYVGEFFRIVRPGGLVLFQIPTERIRGASEPLPPSAFRAAIEIADRIRRFKPGESQLLTIQVTNLSEVTWPAVGSADGWFQVSVGNHWGCRGQTVTIDDGRTSLPHDVTPGQTIACELKVTAPSTPGKYQLEIDLVQEGFAWFAEKGSRSVSVNVHVGSGMAHRLLGRGQDSALPPTDATQSEPVMEMYGTPEPTVRAWISTARGHFVESFDSDEISREPSRDWRREFFIASR
jgi:SAM-dependent methyltransferase